MHQQATHIIRALTDTRLSMATAESCTGGMIADILTDVPGASSCFKGGAVVYTRLAKQVLAGIPEAILKEFTEVSVFTTHILAEKIKDHLKSDVSLAVTGYLGPTGGTKKTPRGTVYIVGMSDRITICRVLHLKGTRLQNKRRATLEALKMVKRILND